MNDAAILAEQATKAARLLAMMSNPNRLMLLCALLEGEQPVSALHGRVGLSQGAVSQHLSKLRALDLVAARREGQSIHYRLNGPEVAAILETLHRLYCQPDAVAAVAETAQMRRK